MKRIISLIMLGIFVLSIFTGCGLLSQIEKLGKQDKAAQADAQSQEADNAQTRENPDGPETDESTTDNSDSSAGESTDGGAQQGNVKKISMKLYFANKDNSAVPYEAREVEVKDGAIMRAAIEELLKGPQDKNLRKAIPDGTRLLGINRKDNLAVVDFSKEYTAANDIAEVVERISVVNTLTEISGIEKVKILVEGKALIGPSGEPFGELTRTALDKNGYPIPGEMKTITLYFGNDNADKVVAEKRQVAVTQGEALEKVIFEELKKGPARNGLHPVIPEGTRLLWVKTKDGICTLNLSREFVDNAPGGSAGESMTLNSIVNSLTELSQVKKVMFLIEGEKREVYEHVIFDEPFSRNEEIIQK